MGAFSSLHGLPRRACFCLGLLLLALLAKACGGPVNAGYTMRLDASAEKVSYGKRFFILPGVTKDRAEDARFRSAADVLAQALAGKGYERVSSLEQADLGIYLGAAVSAGNRHAVFSSPYGAGGPQAQRTFVFTEYTRELTVEAVDMARYRANDPRSIVWRMQLVSVGATESLEKAMPYFAAAVAHYAGSSGFFTVQVGPDMTVSPVNLEPRKRIP